ncbi:hypothetical protein ACW9HQ_36770 [Nocardia gipuzkoensis]
MVEVTELEIAVRQPETSGAVLLEGLLANLRFLAERLSLLAVRVAMGQPPDGAYA